MFSFRSLLLIAVVWLLAYGIVRLRRAKRSPAQQQALTTKMVRCHYCGLYAPEEEAVVADKRTYCCSEHRDQDIGV